MSQYFQSLTGDVRSRYEDKVKIISYVDPYTIQKSECRTDFQKLPVIQLIDISNYFALAHSFYTGEQVKAFKSLEAYDYVKAGFVKHICYTEICGNFIVIAEVRHSQRMNEKPLNPWLILKPDASISSAHCDCMAGLGEVCSHAAAIAFYLLRLNESIDSKSCTSVLCTWTVPKFAKTVIPQKIKNIDWGKEMKSFDNVQRSDISPLQGEALHRFLRKVEEIEPRAVIFSVMQPYAQSRIPEMIQHLPAPLADLYNPDLYLHYSLNQLQSVQIPNLSQVEREAIQQETVKQSKNINWFKYRAGRITGSMFKSACKTSVDKPSLSLVKRICYPLRMTYKTTAMIYGIDHEHTAIEAYRNHISKEHLNVTISSVGICISKTDSFLAATPDAMVKCGCCGLGCVEVKCPHRMIDSKLNVEKFARMKDSCLILLDNGSFALDRNHEYFYQIQLQMHVTETKYCDFLVWSKQEYFLERIYYEPSFMDTNIKKVKVFHSNVIVPELLVKWYTKSMVNVEAEIFCECKGIDDGREMLRCANEDCQIKWFHYQCINIKKIANSSYWFCKNCSVNILGSNLINKMVIK